MRLADPIYLLLFIPVFYLAWRVWHGEVLPPTLRFSDIRLAGGALSTTRARLWKIPHCLRIGALALIVIALARPQYGFTRQEITSKGIDIMICLDRSGSMRAIDPRLGQEKLNPNDTRLNNAKKVIRDFIAGRKNDRLGLIVFAGKAYTQCPLTLDYGILLTFLDTIEIAERDSSTAIGDAIGTAVNHLKNSDAKSKVIILVTDGESNSGLIDPITAAKTASQFGIKVYTVGVGSKTGAHEYVRDFFGGRFVPAQYGLDEETLKEVAQITQAVYFPAENPDAMEDVFHKIDSMEKTDLKFENYTEYSEKFLIFALIALCLLTGEVILRTSYLRSIP